MNENNPYAAPKTAVADHEPQVVLDRPVQVVRAVWCLWFSLAIGFIHGAYQAFVVGLQGISSPSFKVIFALTWVVILALYFWLLRSAYNGRNWARITLLVVFALGMVISIFGFKAQLAMGIWVNLVAIVQLLLSIAALFLLFTPASNEWYRSMRR